jgi:hypothetical protein
VPVGASSPTHELTTKSGTPLSANVGTSGRDLVRCALDTATGLSFPDLTCRGRPQRPYTPAKSYRPARRSWLGRRPCRTHGAVKTQCQRVAIGG